MSSEILTSMVLVRHGNILMDGLTEIMVLHLLRHLTLQTGLTVAQMH